jgi:hypothetical protein
VLVQSILAIGRLMVVGWRRNPESSLWPLKVPHVQATETAAWMPRWYGVEFDTSRPAVHVAQAVILSANIASDGERNRYESDFNPRGVRP